MAGVQIDAVLTVGGAEYSVNIQHDGDGVLDLAWERDFHESYKEVLAALGQDITEEEVEDSNFNERLSAILKKIGIIAAAQEKFDAYFQEDEPEIEREIYSPGVALGGVQFRVCKTKAGRVAIQSWDTADGDGYRTYGTMSCSKWEKWTESECRDHRDPGYISRLCGKLDGTLDPSDEDEVND